jgi:hypothetical protein
MFHCANCQYLETLIEKEKPTPTFDNKKPMYRQNTNTNKK